MTWSMILENKIYEIFNFKLRAHVLKQNKTKTSQVNFEL